MIDLIASAGHDPASFLAGVGFVDSSKKASDAVAAVTGTYLSSKMPWEEFIQYEDNVKMNLYRERNCAYLR